jgi:hypothetical protein
VSTIVEIFFGCLVLGEGIRLALNHRGAAEFPLRARVKWRQRHPRLAPFSRWPRVREDGSVEGVTAVRVAGSLFCALWGGVALAAGIAAALH